MECMPQGPLSRELYALHLVPKRPRPSCMQPLYPYYTPIPILLQLPPPYYPRYVPTAATHGRGLKSPARAPTAVATRLKESLSRGQSVGRLVDGSTLEKMVGWSSSLRTLNPSDWS